MILKAMSQNQDLAELDYIKTSLRAKMRSWGEEEAQVHLPDIIRQNTSRAQNSSRSFTRHDLSASPRKPAASFRPQTTVEDTFHRGSGVPLPPGLPVLHPDVARALALAPRMIMEALCALLRSEAVLNVNGA